MKIEIFVLQNGYVVKVIKKVPTGYLIALPGVEPPTREVTEDYVFQDVNGLVAHIKKVLKEGERNENR